MIRFPVAAIFFFVAQNAGAQSVVVRGAGREVLVSLGSLPSDAIEIHDPTDGGKAKRLRGVALTAVLARLPAPKESDALAVRCDDGWLSLLPFSTIVRFPEARLAVAEERDGRAVPLAAPRGPVFLVWPNVARPEVSSDAELAENGFTFAVAALEYVRLADFAPPPAATVNGRRGRALFQHHCQHCHAIAGTGGIAGWDLAQPKIFSYRDERYVRAYILDPRRANPSGHMSPFRDKLAPTELDALVAYLRAL